MDYLGRKKYRYVFTASFETIKEKLGEIVKGKWYDISNVSGKVDEDGTFDFRSTFSFFNIATYGQTVYLKGEISGSGKETVVNITLSPNVTLVIAAYLLILVSLNVLFGDNSLMGKSNTKLANMVAIFSVEFILFIIIQAKTFFLRRKFEKAIHLALRRPKIR